MHLGRLGVFAFLDGLDGPATAQLARAVERLGYGTLWIVEALGRDALTHAAHILARTDRLVVASGVASIWAREPSQMMAAARTCAELSGGRFVLGIGVNSAKTATVRGLPYGRPVSAMRDYLLRMRQAAYAAPAPSEDPPIVLAALAPRMLGLAAAESRGTLTYLMTPEHTARARTAVGSGWVCVEQAVLLETDAVRARRIARSYVQFYLPTISVYATMLRSLGFGDGDLAGELSDRLVDAIVAWGSAGQIRERIEAQFRAGATHVCILPLSPTGGVAPDRRALDALAPR